MRSPPSEAELGNGGRSVGLGLDGRERQFGSPRPLQKRPPLTEVGSSIYPTNPVGNTTSAVHEASTRLVVRSRAHLFLISFLSIQLSILSIPATPTRTWLRPPHFNMASRQCTGRGLRLLCERRLLQSSSRTLSCGGFRTPSTVRCFSAIPQLPASKIQQRPK